MFSDVRSKRVKRWYSIPKEITKSICCPAITEAKHFLFDKKKETLSLMLYVEVNNGYIVPAIYEANLMGDKIYFLHDEKSFVPITVRIRKPSRIRELIEKRFGSIEIENFERCCEQILGVHDFDFLCRNRLYGFLQAWLFHLLGDGEVEPNFLLKRKRTKDSKSSLVNVIADLIVGFVPPYAMLRSEKNDYWYQCAQQSGIMGWKFIDNHCSDCNEKKGR